jgi:phospholipase/lecithinase/hemolysin
MRYFLSLVFAFLSSISIANPIKNIVVFGDSLSDNGNLYELMHHSIPKSPPYYDGRFTDGLVWIEQLAEKYFPNHRAQHLQDYAFGAAGVLIEDEDDDDVLTLRSEVKTYLTAHNDQADPDTLFFIWIGGNNYLGNPENVDETVNDVITGINIDVQRLIKHGARHFMIMGLPDLGKTPAAKDQEDEADLTKYSMLHNMRLTHLFEELKSSHPDVQWLYFDTNQIFLDIFANPGNYNISDTTNSCFDSLIQTHTKSSVISIAQGVSRQAIQIKNEQPNHELQNCDGYLFFDQVHPTKQVHEIAAHYVHALLEQEHVVFEND